MGRAPCCDKNGLKKGPWTTEEDRLLVSYIKTHGPGNWRTLPKNAGLERCGKSCRLRWTNYLRPDIKRGRFSFEEEETIIQLHSMLGNKWSEIASRLPGRTDNEIKNYWNTHIKKRLLKMGIDPVTHAPKLDLLDLSSILNAVFCNQLSLLNLSNLVGNQPTAMTLELLRLSSILSISKQQDPSSSFPKNFQENHQLLMNSDLQHQRENGYYQTPVQDAFSQEMKQQLMQENLEVLSSSTSSPSLNYYNYPNPDQNLVPSELSKFFANQPNVTCTSSYSDHMTSHLPENLNLQSANYINQNSTPLTSSSTYINSTSTSTEDEKESYCSSLFDFEIPESLDIADFL